MTQEISARAMLVSLRISSWSARKFDKQATAKVAHDNGTATDVGRYTKNLLPQDADAYKTLTTAISDARTTHYAQSLSWTDDGWRLLPTANYMEYTAKVRSLQQTFDAALDAFLLEYPAMKEQAPLRLNGLYREEDWPTVAQLRARYSFAVEFSPMPSGDDFRLNLSDEEIAAIARSTENRVKTAIDEAQADAVARLHDCVSHICTRLADPKAIFRDSLIENARELTDVLTRLNLTGDTRLESLRRDVARLAQHDPQDLRELPLARAEAANEAQRILDAFTATFGSANHGR